MSVRILKDNKNRAIDCVKEFGKVQISCKNNFTGVCNGCKIYTGHPEKENLFRS